MVNTREENHIPIKDAASLNRVLGRFLSAAKLYADWAVYIWLDKSRPPLMFSNESETMMRFSSGKAKPLEHLMADIFDWSLTKKVTEAAFGTYRLISGGCMTTVHLLLDELEQGEETSNIDGETARLLASLEDCENQGA